MSRMTYSFSPAFKSPQLGEVVFYFPERVGDGDPRPVPAIIHRIRDLSKGVVDLTAFMPTGPAVQENVEQAGGPVEGRWSHYQG